MVRIGDSQSPDAGFESHRSHLKHAVCPGGEEAVLKTVGLLGLQVRILCTALTGG